MSETPMSGKPAAARPCPICAKPMVAAFKPFCSKRCADVDLNRWLSGVYAVPVAEEDEAPDDEARDEAQAEPAPRAAPRRTPPDEDPNPRRRR
jgi:hypothetical protein